MRRLIAKISVLPTDSKNDNFVLALVDYFSKEFKNANLQAKKNNGYVKVALNGKYNDKYDCVIIDCCNGKMYLRGADCKDKYFGRLSKFNTGRKSDAYHCVNYNATRIINRINKLNASFVKDNVLDMRDDVVAHNILDLRENVLDTRESVCDARELVLDTRTASEEAVDILDTRLSDDIQDESILDLRNILDNDEVVLDLREDTTSPTVLNVDEMDEQYIQEVFEENATAFIQSERCEQFLRNNDADYIMNMTLSEIMDYVGSEYVDNVVKTIKEKIGDTSEYSVNDEIIMSMFTIFLAYNDDLWKQYAQIMKESEPIVVDLRVAKKTKTLPKNKIKQFFSKVFSNIKSTIMDLR